MDIKTGEDGFPYEQTDNPFYEVAPGVRLVRFKGDDIVRLVAQRKCGCNPNKIYEILVDTSRFEGYVQHKATVNVDGRIIVYLEGSNRCSLERMAIACLHRYLKDCAKRCRRGYARAKRKRAEKRAAQEDLKGE